MKLAILTAAVSILLLGLVFELLRRRQLREKYAVLWLGVGLLTLPAGFIGLNPQLLNSISRHLGVANGASLVLFLAVVFLLLVCIHLSWEASRLEDETRSLAEEVALIRTEMRGLRAEVDALRSGGPDASAVDSGSESEARVEIIAPRLPQPVTSEEALIGER